MGKGDSLFVGLTGGMGCGKSTVGKLFAEREFLRLDADETVREEILNKPAVVSALRDRFGDGAVTPIGTVDRKALAGIVFRDDEALSWLEKLIHPQLWERWKELFDSATDQRFICEVPLLFEKQMENWFDSTVCVTTGSALQLQRLEQREIPPELAYKRIAKQLPLARKCELADFVILNDGSLEFLREQVDALAQCLSP